MKKLKKGELIEKYGEKAYESLCNYSQDGSLSSPKKGFEKEWKEAQEEIHVLATLAKLVEREDNAPPVTEEEHLNKLIRSIFAGATTISVEKASKDLKVCVLDNVSPNAGLKITFTPVAKCLILKSYQISA